MTRCIKIDWAVKIRKIIGWRFWIRIENKQKNKKSNQLVPDNNNNSIFWKQEKETSTQSILPDS